MARNEKYLDAGTEIAVKVNEGLPNAANSKEEIVLTNVQEDTHPLKKEACLSTKIGKVTIYFSKNKVRSRVALEDSDVPVAILSEQLRQINYTIPFEGESKGYSPSVEMYKNAVPLADCVWLVKANDVPTDLVVKMKDKGCKVDTTLLDLTETKSKIARSIETIQDKIVNALESADSSMAAMDKDFESVMGDSQFSEATKKEIAEKYLKRGKEVEARLKKLRKDLTSGTNRFGISEAAFQPERLSVKAHQIRTNAQERVKPYLPASETETVPALSTANPVQVSLQSFSLSEALAETE